MELSSDIPDSTCETRLKNPFDDPFFKDSNFPVMPGFDRFKPTQPTNPHSIEPEQPKLELLSRFNERLEKKKSNKLSEA